eukprot:TRINITY_DN22270_c0_g1_i1.p1 TRINITY_DN22270_c0_g1~~TRINITY_DN22270_c0_g1_i1.p1  ORF type:complete len:273 (+),score=44.80 TRINITY_DN22270_c0_g1_i1:54-872(+)
MDTSAVASISSSDLGKHEPMPLHENAGLTPKPEASNDALSHTMPENSLPPLCGDQGSTTVLPSMASMGLPMTPTGADSTPARDVPPTTPSNGSDSNTKVFSLQGIIDHSMIPANFGGSGSAMNIHMDPSLFLKSQEVLNSAFPGLNLPPSGTPNPNTDFGTQSTADTDSQIQNVEEPQAGTFINVTPYLTLPQHAAAKKMGIPSSTLSKRWKEASCSRKWPFRTVSKLDKEILTLLKNVETSQSPLPPHVEETLGILLKRRQEELRTVIIRI